MCSPNSEDIIESERKYQDKNKNPNTDKQIRKIGNLDQMEEQNDLNNETNNSHNISNIEEFINELEF